MKDKTMNLKEKILNKKESFNYIALYIANTVVFLSLIVTVVFSNSNYRSSMKRAGINDLVSENEVVAQSCLNYIDKKASEIKTVLDYQKTKGLSYEQFVQYLKDTYTNPEYLSSGTRFQLVSPGVSGGYEGIEITGKGTTTAVDYTNYPADFTNSVLVADGTSGDKTTQLNETLSYSVVFTDPIDKTKTDSCVHAHIRLTDNSHISKTCTLLSVFSTDEVVAMFPSHRESKRSSDSFLIDTDGNFLIKSNDTFSGETNFIEALQKYNKFSINDYSKIEFSFGMSGCNSTIQYKNANGETCVYAYSNRSGQYWLSVSCIPIKSINTTVPLEFLFYIIVGVMFAAIIFDMALLNNFNKKLRLSVLTVEQEKQNALAASKAKSEFLSKMSHDIRTPINGVIGMTDIAMNHIDDKNRVMDSLTKIDTSAHHLLSLINDVLDMSSIEAGKFEIKRAKMNLDQLMDNIDSIIVGQLSGRKLDYKLNKNIKHSMIIGDQLRLREVAINIIGNAVKYTPDGGSIEVTFEEKEINDFYSEYTLTCKDTGVGMSKEFMEHIFEEFSQENGGARTTYKGTGLGMAITKQIVEMMDGRIDVESELNKGSTFTVVVRCDLCSDEGKKLEDASVDSIKGMKVLLVEDNELNMEIATEILTDEGLEVSQAFNGEEALEFVKSHPAGCVDVILMDIMMPVMDGLEATRQIRALSSSFAKEVPIIAMTANAFDTDKRMSLDAGMNAHVSKPIDFKLLSKVLGNFRKAKK